MIRGYSGTGSVDPGLDAVTHKGLHNTTAEPCHCKDCNPDRLPLCVGSDERLDILAALKRIGWITTFKGLTICVGSIATHDLTLDLLLGNLRD